MKKKPKKFQSGEDVAFLNPYTGNVDVGILVRYTELDEDEDQEDYRVLIKYEKSEISTFETNVYKR